MITIWKEDDATYGKPGHESLRAAYLRIAGKEFNVDQAIDITEGTGGQEYFMPDGFEIWSSYPGASTISVHPNSGRWITIVYTNHKSKTAVRRILPLKMWFGRTQYHSLSNQWLLEALDEGKGEIRNFAVADIKEWNAP